MATRTGEIAIAPDNPDRCDLGRDRRHMEDRGREAGDRFSVVHHPIAPRALASPAPPPPQRGRVLVRDQGTLGALLGEEVVTAGPGTWVFKPREQWHTFWNAGDTPCEIVEIISPPASRTFFRELAELYSVRERF